jgi:hypothetical protein
MRAGMGAEMRAEERNMKTAERAQLSLITQPAASRREQPNSSYCCLIFPIRFQRRGKFKKKSCWLRARSSRSAQRDAIRSLIKPRVFTCWHAAQHSPYFWSRRSAAAMQRSPRRKQNKIKGAREKIRRLMARAARSVSSKKVARASDAARLQQSTRLIWIRAACWRRRETDIHESAKNWSRFRTKEIG